MLIGVLAEETLLPLSTKPGLVFDGGPFGQLFKGDIFFQHRIYIIGFVAPNLVDETAPLDGENFPTTYVTNGYQGIFPDLIDDPDENFYDFTHSSVPVLAPQLFAEHETFYFPTIPAIPPLHPIGRYVDTDIFYTPEFKGNVFPDLVVDNDVIRASVIRRDGDDVFLLLEAFNDSDTIYAPSMARALLPGLVTASDIIYAVAQSAFLAPPAFSPGDTLYTALIFNQLLPSSTPVDDVFIGPSVGTPGRLALFVDDDIFFVPNMGIAPLLPLLVDNDDAFLPSVIASNPAIYPLFTDIDVEDTFYAPNVIIFQALAPHLWPDVDVFYSVPSVALGQPLFPALFNEGDVFFAPITTLVPVLFPALFADTEVFFAPTVRFDQFLVQQFTAVDTDNFYSPSIAALSTFSGMIAIDGPIMPSVPQPTVILIEG
jgi:hypothetical protein